MSGQITYLLPAESAATEPVKVSPATVVLPPVVVVASVVVSASVVTVVAVSVVLVVSASVVKVDEPATVVGANCEDDDEEDDP